MLIRLANAGAAPGSARNPVPLVAEPGVFFDAPRWSPDGRTIAVERHREGALPEIALVDVATKTVRVLAADAGTRFTMPAWRPDGGAVVAAAAPEEKTFNLVELPVDGSAARQLTHVTGGATRGIGTSLICTDFSGPKPVRGEPPAIDRASA